MRVRFLTFLLGCGLCGCAATQDYHYNLTQRCRADMAWCSNFGIWSGCSRDYHDGWKRGYYDMSTGQCEAPPAVPPHHYWSPKYQSLEGRAAIDDWYSGWQDGATAAVQDGRPFFHALPTSPTPPVNPFDTNNPNNFHCEPGQSRSPLEKLPPSPPTADYEDTTHTSQPQVHVASVPRSFVTESLSDGLIEEPDVEAAEPAADLIEEPAASDNDPYYSNDNQ
jgi:hypothetical protein